jgi:hypothetical protein
MRVFVVVTHYMFGLQGERVFSSSQSARDYISQREDGNNGRPEVVEFQVQGEMEKEDVVYTSAWYDAPNDIHHLSGVYGNYDDARAAAGEQGLALAAKLDAGVSGGQGTA